MKTSDKIINALGLIGMIVAVIISAIEADFFAVCGWLVGLLLYVTAIAQDCKLKDWEEVYSESVREKAKMKCEIAELRALIRELEWEGKDNEN